jgi:hypothetical protein
MRILFARKHFAFCFLNNDEPASSAARRLMYDPHHIMAELENGHVQGQPAEAERVTWGHQNDQ